MLTTPPYLIPNWPLPSHIKAVVTTRGDHFNLATHVDDDPERVAANRIQLTNCLGLQHDPCWLNQVHGTTLIELTQGADPEHPTADASFTRSPGKVCAVLTADCLPVLFYDRATHAVAALHAGWRGLQAGILAKAVCALTSDPSSLSVWLGPAISGPYYQVGPEVYSAFCDTGSALADAFSPDADRWRLDIATIAAIQLRQLGVRQITASGWCTFSQPDLFFSFRRDGKKSGRMASLIWISQE